MNIKDRQRHQRKKFDALFHGIGKHKHAKVEIQLDETVTPVQCTNKLEHSIPLP